MNSEHILPHYDLALENIHNAANNIADSLKQKLALIRSIVAQSDNLSQEELNGIIAADDGLKEEASLLALQCASTLIQFHPLGRDLRLVLTLSRCADKLKECSGEITSIARRLKNLVRNPSPSVLEIVLPLLDMASEEFLEATTGLKMRDGELARQTLRDDKKLDKAHRKALKMLVSAGEGTPSAPDSFSSFRVHLLFIIRAIERIGDIAKSIAAAVIFWQEARDVRHVSSH